MSVHVSMSTGVQNWFYKGLFSLLSPRTVQIWLIKKSSTILRNYEGPLP